MYALIAAATIASASAYPGRSEKPVHDVSTSRPPEAQRAEALAARRQVDDLVALARVLGAHLQRAADDLAVEGARETAVARHAR